MENENRDQDTLKKLDTLTKLRTSEELYLLVSLCTNMPFVQCDPDTFDDVVYVYEKKEDIEREGMRFLHEKQPVQITKLSNAMLLTFYTNLYTMGVNCIVFNGFMENEYKIQLVDLVSRPANPKAPDGRPWVENPSLHLTALYFMQELRRKNYTEIPPELTDMQEELVAHFTAGTYVLLVGENNKIPVLKHPNGDAFLPVYTDYLEVGKFRVEEKMKMMVLKAAQVFTLLPPEAKGFVVNPGGVNLQLPVRRNGADAVKSQMMEAAMQNVQAAQAKAAEAAKAQEPTEENE